MNIYIRKFLSLNKRLTFRLFNSLNKFKLTFLTEGTDIGTGIKVFRNVECISTDKGQIMIGNNVSICSGAKIACLGGNISIGDNVHIGENTIIVCRNSIEIGKDTLIAEYVVIRDQDHSIDTRPINKAGFKTTPIIIGEDVWLGAKSTILRGSIIENGAVIGAHSLVNKKIKAYTLAVGTPAKEIKKI